jgi:16S rRNA (cytidine1402-2'-O)-methyltransferase
VAERRTTAPGPGGTLFVIATPIGNLADLGARARATLTAVPLLAAEDTRVSSRLLVGMPQRPRLVSFHARNAARRMPDLLAHLRAGGDLGLVSDAGTPGISDPGAELVSAWLAEGGRVVPVPGPSAVTAAVSATGIAGPRWVFEGFLPRKGRERRERLHAIAADGRGAVVFEAPDRLADTLADLARACGRDRSAAVCRELTKIHEQIVHGTLGELAEAAGVGDIVARGEIVIVVGATATPTGATVADRADALESARAEVDRLTAAGLARGEAARRVARTTGLSRRGLYRD